MRCLQFLIALKVAITAHSAPMSFIDQLKQHYSGVTQIQAQFTQEKRLTELDLRIASSGRFMYSSAKEAEVLWKVERPSPLELRLSASGVILKNGQEKKRQIPTSMKSILPLLQLDFEKMEQHYLLEAHPKRQLILVPKSTKSPMRKVKMKFSQNLHLVEVELHEKNEDVIQIQFFAHKMKSRL